MRTASATALTALVSLFGSSQAAYTLQDDYSGSKFFSMFDFFTDADPTHGYVDYVSQSSAQSAGLINTNNGQVYMGVDSKNKATGRGRQSVRVTSKATYNHALIILDLAHMPGSICGTWPAFWTVGPNWPNAGEIDIIEGVNSQQSNSATLHTGPGCSIGTSSKRAQAFSGTLQTSNCDVNAAGQATNAGCSISSKDTSSYGDGFNAANGGVYATEWTSSGISVWHFARNSIPSDINSSPDPSSWGVPLANFPSTSCNIDSVIKDQQIVFDTTFCGDWAGNVFSSDPTCSAKANSCQDFVQNNPQAFADAYWSINSLKVFTSDGKSQPSQAASKTAVPSATGAKPTVSSATGAKPSLCLYGTCGPDGQPSVPATTSGKPTVTSAPGGKPTVSSAPAGKPALCLYETCNPDGSPATATSAAPPVSTGSGRPVPSITGSNLPTGPAVAPTSFATSVSQQRSSSRGPWTGWGQGSTWTHGGNGGGRWGSQKRDAPSPTAFISEPEMTPAIRSLVPPMVRRDAMPGNVDLNMVRRHLSTHAHQRRRLGDHL